MAREPWAHSCLAQALPILALATEKEFTIGYEMADAAAKSGIDGEVRITRPTTLGAHVVM